MLTLEFREDDLQDQEVRSLLAEHLSSVAELSPPESVHALDVDALQGEDVTFWSAWSGDELAGCGALQELDAAHVEVKSMRTASGFLRMGVATAMLDHLLAVAKERGYRRVSLETGAQEGFAPARALYAGHGFRPCEPFGTYREDPNSVFMTKELEH